VFGGKIFANKNSLDFMNRRLLPLTFSSTLIIQSVFFLYYALKPLSFVEVIFGGGTKKNEFVYRCNTSSSEYTLWMVLQILFICFVFAMCLYQSWKSRSAPSAFFDSGAFFNSMLMMVVLVSVLVPLQFLSSAEDPTMMLLIRGFGCLTISLCCSISLFGPLIMVFVDGNQNEQITFVETSKSRTRKSSLSLTDHPPFRSRSSSI